MQCIAPAWWVRNRVSCAVALHRFLTILALVLPATPAASFSQSEREMRVVVKSGTSSLTF